MITSKNILTEIQNPKNWKRTHKKSYDVYMCRPLPGTQCTNKLEGSRYITDKNKQFIISGTAGETWAIDVNKLAKTYTFADGTPIMPDTLRAKCKSSGQIEWVKLSTRTDTTPNWAFHLPKSIQNFPVKTSWGDTLYANRTGVGHLKGDFIVCADAGGHPNFNDTWVVNGEIFPKTYDLHAFPHMFDAAATSCETIKPVQNFTVINKRKVENNKSNDFTYELYKKIKDLMSSGKYASVETTQLELEYKNERKVLYARLTEEDGKDTYIYTCADSGNNIVINRYKDSTKDSEIILGKETESIKIFMSMLSVVNVESYNRIELLHNSMPIIRESFEAYSGDSTSIDSVMAEYNDMVYDNEEAAIYAFEAAIMQLKYINLSKHVNTKYNGYLFRGQGKMPDKYINRGFSSLSTSINIASGFAGRGNESEVLAFTDISDSFLINMRHVAIYGIDNKQDDKIEYEILACDSLCITKGRRLGTINNTPIYLAKLNKAKGVPVTNSFYKLYNYDSIYALKLLLNNLSNFNDIINDPFNNFDDTVRFKTENFNIDISLGQRSIVINGKQLSRKEFNSFLINHGLKADTSIKRS